MKILVYSRINESNIKESLGLPEYSYYFALRDFLPSLREIGEVISITDPQAEVDELYEQCIANDEACVFLSFTLPHTTALDLECPTVCAFAWEFSNIPYEKWGDDENNDWNVALEKIGNVLTLSRAAKRAIDDNAQPEVKVAAIPTPVWDRFDEFRAGADHADGSAFEINLSLDSRQIDLENLDPLTLGSAINTEYYEYAVGLIEQRDGEIVKLNEEFVRAKNLVEERDAQLIDANSTREQAESLVEHAESLVVERDSQLNEANSQRSQAETVVNERDVQIEQANSEREYAESVVRERDSQLQTNNRERESLEEQLLTERKNFAEHRATRLGRLNGWLLARKEKEEKQR